MKPFRNGRFFYFCRMNPQIIVFPETKCIGKKMTFSYADYRAFELWSCFMPRRNEIINTINSHFLNVQVNPENFSFGPHELFDKWAVAPVANFDLVPNDMDTLVIQEGLYAVFHYKGDETTVAQYFNQIYTVWLPNSGYQLDSRPQFEVLGEKYKKNDPNSEEEIWIPIKK
ncbi:MAG: hypothetical protein RLZZ231_64 [Bacteroidota bacterium]